jgi:ubiquinone/menaquinone biosynthesis C-methylase UbiE
VEDSNDKTIRPVDGCYVSVEEGYRRWALNYDRDPNPLLALEERQLRPKLPALRGKRVLDLACGTGRWLNWLLGEGARSGVGVDISQAMLAGTREKPLLQNRLVRGDCCTIPFASAAFDFVICSFALGHLSDLEPAIQEIRRVAAPGANVCVSDLHPQAYARGWRTGFRDHLGSAEIMTWPRSIHEQLAAWNSVGFTCHEKAEFQLGEPERSIFVNAGKDHLFAKACQDPAVLIFHFRSPLSE